MAQVLPTAYSSIKSNVLNMNGPTPLQGYDVGVWVFDEGRQRNVLLGQFNRAVIIVQLGTEKYLGANQKQATLLDGEIQIDFNLAKGHLSADVVEETFGFQQFVQDNVYLRSPRFTITFALDPVDWMVLDEPSVSFGEVIQRYPAGSLALTGCKMDRFIIAAMAGKKVVANEWQGSCEGLLTTIETLARMEAMNSDTKTEFDANGNPVDVTKVRTFQFVGYSDQASTYFPLWEPSRTKGDGLISFLTYANLVAQRAELMLVSYIPGVKDAINAIDQLIDRIFGESSNPSYALPADPSEFVHQYSYSQGLGSIDGQSGIGWLNQAIAEAKTQLAGASTAAQRSLVQQNIDHLQGLLDQATAGQLNFQASYSTETAGMNALQKLQQEYNQILKEAQTATGQKKLDLQQMLDAASRVLNGEIFKSIAINQPYS